MKYNIAVIGATSSVAGQIFSVLVERNFPCKKVHAISQAHHIGKQVSFGENSNLDIEDIRNFDFSNIDIIFICPGIDISCEIIDKAASNKSFVIDLSDLYKNSMVPPIVAGVNFWESNQKIVTSAHPCVVALATALAPLNNAAKIRRMTITTMQAVSDLGKDAMDELYNQTKSKYMQGDLAPKIFHRQIAFNIIPQIGEIEGNKYSASENQICSEICKIVSQNIKISATCIRVPVFIGHSISANVEFDGRMDAEEACELLSESDDLTIQERTISAIETSNEGLVFVSRIRDNANNQNTIDMILSFDNLVFGSSLNAVKIAEEYVKRISI